MLIDRTHRPWAFTTGTIFAVSGVLYALYARGPVEPSGGSWPGLAYGIAGFALMLYAGLIGARRKVRIWRIGRAQTWMRGHLWLGLLSLPLILFHAGFTFGAALTSVLMWLFVIVTVSGLVGAWLQHSMPRRMMRDIPMETIFEQIEHVRGQLLSEADTVVADACGKLELETVAMAGQGEAAAAALASTVRLEAEESSPLREFYQHEMRPFLEQPATAHLLGDRTKAVLRFEKLRAVLPDAYHAAVTDLENICEEARQLTTQARMHRVLHGWQMVHVPISIALLVLAVVHVVVALRY